MRVYTLFSILFMIPILLMGFFTPSQKSKGIPSLEGVWEDPETNTLYTIHQQGEGYTVVSAIDDDGEVYEVSDVVWENSILKWTVRTPSTGYVFRYTTIALRGDELECSWSGTHGSGTETLNRK